MSAFESVAYHCRTCNYTCSVAEHPRLAFRCEATPACRGAPFVLHKQIAPGAQLFPVERIRERPPTLWRYREALPVDHDASKVSLGEGMTPLVADVRHAAAGRRWLKLDHLMPTGSYKDRGATVLVSKAHELGVAAIVEDSSGNAGSAIAAYAARTGAMVCTILCPAATSPGKLAQIQGYGAQLQLVAGNRTDTTRAVLDAAQTTFYASHNWSPFFMEGGKTVAFELVEQLGWHAPDHVICPLGFGSIYLALHLGFTELLQAGVIAHMPRLHGVQAATCAPLFAAVLRAAPQSSTLSQLSGIAQYPPNTLHQRGSIAPVAGSYADTLAEGITAADPMRGDDILEAVASTRGSIVAVDDEAIQRGLSYLSRQGVYVEPTSAVVVDALGQLERGGVISPHDEVVSILTGIGLKATDKIIKMQTEGRM